MTQGCRSVRIDCPEMMRVFHSPHHVADGPSPLRETIGVAVVGSVSPEPSQKYFAWLLIIYNKIVNGDQRCRVVTRRSEISVGVNSEAGKHMNSGNNK
jgi:hypothetical protein